MSNPFDNEPSTPEPVTPPAPENPSTLTPATGVTILVDPEALLRSMVGYESGTDDDEIGGPVSGAVLSLAAHQLASELRATVRAQLADVVRENVAEIVRETLASGIRRTNTFGEPIGEPTTVAGLVRDEVHKYLTTETGDYRKRETQIAKTTREVVAAAVKEDLATSLEGARQALRDRYAAGAAELITETIRRVTL